jgi:hypothetical protein
VAERPTELAKDGAAPLFEELERALASGEIDEAEWYRRTAAFLAPRYPLHLGARCEG